MRDRSFGPTVLAGLGGGVLAAVAGSRDWVTLAGPERDDPARQVFWESSPGLGQMPLAGALGLVVLAAWGVVLVGRGTWRRVVAAVGLLAGIGLVATWLVALVDLHDRVATELERTPGGGAETTWTPWFWAAAVAALLCCGAGAVAVQRAGRWPAMGSRYDAPTGRPQPPRTPAAEQDPADLWKALDEGLDPTRDHTRDPTRDQAP